MWKTNFKGHSLTFMYINSIFIYSCTDYVYYHYSKNPPPIAENNTKLLTLGFRDINKRKTYWPFKKHWSIT